MHQDQFININHFLKKVFKKEKVQVFRNKIRIRIFIRLIRIISLALVFMILELHLPTKVQDFPKINEELINSMSSQVLEFMKLRVSLKTQDYQKLWLVDLRMIWCYNKKPSYLDLEHMNQTKVWFKKRQSIFLWVRNMIQIINHFSNLKLDLEIIIYLLRKLKLVESLVKVEEMMIQLNERKRLFLVQVFMMLTKVH